ncbi:MAG: hypothetical protein ACREFP_04475 [Acetobacteraceae bacterium]
MVDIRIRKNERCVIGLPACDYVFSSTRSCFIAYGFSSSALERDILKTVLRERGIEAVEAGGRIDPGKFAFCTKICSKIIVAQFCIVLANNDKAGANANVNIEYGLMLGHNKYVIPFQRDDESLPFNVAGLDTIKYNQANFGRYAIQAVDQAIRETSQAAPAPNASQQVELFMLIKNATFVDVRDAPVERAIFQLIRTFGFNLLLKFDGLSYVFLGNFGALGGHPIVWRLTKLMELLDARVRSIPTRLREGFTDEKAAASTEAFLNRLEIWLIVAGPAEAEEVRSWLKGSAVSSAALEIFTLGEINDTLAQLPGSGG